MKYKIFLRILLVAILFLSFTGRADFVFAKDKGVKELGVPFLKQKYSLSCEIASLRMVLSYKGINIDEDSLIIMMPFSDRNPATINKNGHKIWGDPDEGFVGNIDGKMTLFTGYGVYEKPIMDVAKKINKIDDATTLKSLDKIIDEIEKDNPVIVWGALENSAEMSWFTPKGKFIQAVKGEHARVIVGYEGKIKKPSHIILMDPIYGKIKMTRSDFLKDWGLLGNRAITFQYKKY